ncbi:MAG: ATP-binding protein [Phycisphaerales bacterium]|nr:ATP-binding protein [Phycisphaerales bacterium]
MHATTTLLYDVRDKTGVLMHEHRANTGRESADSGAAAGSIPPGSSRFTETKPLDLTRQWQLMEQAERLARVGGWELDLVTGALFWTGETYRIHETSPAEYTPSLESAIAFYTPASQEIIAHALERARTEGVGWDFELELTTAKGRRIDVRASGVVEARDGRPVRAFGAFQDITERKRLERQVVASEKMESLGRLAGGIAHDFNNWVTAILNYAELGLASSALGTSEHQSLQRIREAAEHASALTRQLLSLARPKPATTAVVDLNELLQTMLPLLSGMVDKSITLRTNLAPRALLARVNASQFRQVLLNLVINARDAMPRGGTLTIQTFERPQDAVLMPPTDQAIPADHYVGFSVSDTGEGMDEHTLDRLFEPFFTTKPGGKGTGLGLATCYSIVNASNGLLEVQSRVGKGATFTVVLPAVPTTAENVQAAPV